MTEKTSTSDYGTSAGRAAAEDLEASPPPPPIAVAVPVGPPLPLPAPSAPPAAAVVAASSSLSNAHTDDEARALASAARAEGLSTIRDHCQHHLSRNPNASYVTWIATLHPENAAVSIDARFLIEGNPWMAVYDETLKGLNGRERAFSDATAPPLSDVDGNAEGAEVEGETTTTTPRSFGGFLDFLVGYALVLTGVLAAAVIEVVSAYTYLSYWVCFKVVDRCSPPGWISWLPLSIAFVVGQSFQLVDAVLLFVSIAMVEAIAAANGLVCTILGCSPAVGRHMHQVTRKTPHVVRWACRRRFEGWEPRRFGTSPRGHGASGAAAEAGAGASSNQSANP